jgi:hypothetical protein
MPFCATQTTFFFYMIYMMHIVLLLVARWLHAALNMLPLVALEEIVIRPYPIQVAVAKGPQRKRIPVVDRADSVENNQTVSRQYGSGSRSPRPDLSAVR